MPYLVGQNDSLPVAFGKNVINEIVYHPQERVYHIVAGTVGTAALDLTPYPEVLGSAVNSLGLSAERKVQVASGVNYAMLKVLESSFKRSMRY